MKDFIVLVLVLFFGSLLENSIWAQQSRQNGAPPKPAVQQHGNSDQDVTVNINDDNGQRETEVTISLKDGSSKSWNWIGQEVPADIQREMEEHGLEISSLVKGGMIEAHVNSTKKVIQQTVDKEGDPNREVTVEKNGDDTKVTIKDNEGNVQAYNWTGEMPQSVADELAEIDVQLREHLKGSEEMDHVTIGAHLKMEMEKTIEGDEVKSQLKTLVDRVISDGPAAQAGLISGDLILKADGKTLSEEYTLLQHLQKHQAGDTVQLLVQRGTKNLTLDLRLGSK